MGKRLRYIIYTALVIEVGLISGCKDVPKTNHFIDGKLIEMDRFDNLDRIGSLQTRRSDEITSSRWGLHFNIYRLDSTLNNIEEIIDKTSQSGVKWVRFKTGGYFDVPANEDYFKWGEMDKIIEGLSRHKIDVFICIANRGIDLNNSSDTVQNAFLREQINEYSDAAVALVKRYGHYVKHWEIMNEPDITPVYIMVVNKVSKSIRQVDPGARILAGSLQASQYSRLKYLITNSGENIDIITFHPYNEFPEALKHHWEVPIADTSGGGYISGSVLFYELQDQLLGFKNKIHLWSGESGYPSSEHTSSWKGRGPWGENIQAKWLLRRFLIDFSLNIPVMIYFNLTESVPGEMPAIQKVNAKGLFTSETGKPKKGFSALQNITSLIDERIDSPIIIQTEFEIIDEGSFTGICGENDKKYLSDNPPYVDNRSPYPIEVVAFTGHDGDMVTYWIPWRMQEYIKPAKINLQIKDVNIPNPLLLDLLNGIIYRPQTDFHNNSLYITGIPLTDYPFAIVPTKLIKIKE